MYVKITVWLFQYRNIHISPLINRLTPFYNQYLYVFLVKNQIFFFREIFSLEKCIYIYTYMYKYIHIYIYIPFNERTCIGLCINE